MDLHSEVLTKFISVLNRYMDVCVHVSSNRILCLGRALIYQVMFVHEQPLNMLSSYVHNNVILNLEILEKSLP